MSKIRIYELAKELNMSSKELIEKIKELDIDVNSHMSTLENEEANLIKELFGGNKEDTEEKESTDEVQDSKDNKKDTNKINRKKDRKKGDGVIIDIENEIIVKDLAEKMDVGVSQLITKLIALGVMVNQNQSIDSDIASTIAEEFGFEVNIIQNDEETDIADEFSLDFEDKEEDLKSRPPVVTVMGHVDHGKTSLLDAIRSTSVTTGEAGGITQHIGAYAVNINNKKIVFLDTPGHEAFTSMRARGAQVTDVAILVVAADDGVMPQTVEAIAHAKAAGVPILVAINKMDKPEANIDRIKQELVDNELIPEDWGGDTITVPVSAKKREGIEEILEMIILVAEMEELKANPNRKAVGTVIEAELDKGRGPMATALVQKGTLKVGDTIVSGTSTGKIRAMLDERGKNVKKATPSTPVLILGLSEVPEAGELIYAVKDEKTGRKIADFRRNQIREGQLKSNTKVTLDNLFERIKMGEIKDLNIIIKADVRGSIEALAQSLEKLDTEEVRINIVRGGAGGITENDVMLASASNALIIGFNVRPNLNAIEVAKREEVDIRTYRVIYEAIDDIKAAVKGMHAPKIVEEVLGRAEVRATFRLPNGNTIAGIYVLDGKILRNASVRLLRDDVVVFDGAISSLKRFKDDAREVSSGYEAGLGFENYNDIKENDMLEAYIMKEVQQ